MLDAALHDRSRAYLKYLKLYSKQPNLELTQDFGLTAFSVSSERHGQSGVNEPCYYLRVCVAETMMEATDRCSSVNIGVRFTL